MSRVLLTASLLSSFLCACASAPTPQPRAPAASAAGADTFVGVFDDHAQVWAAREKSAPSPPPHWVVAIEPTPLAEWTLWRVHLDAPTPLDAVWAMRRSADALLPHRMATSAAAPAAAFDPRQWTSLDACALAPVAAAAAGAVHLAADAASCAALAPALGVQAALLPLEVEREGEWLHLRFYADQARGAGARDDLRKVRFYAGWAALNGAGPTAPPNADWHMDRGLRLGNEGGRAELRWRDGSASGYSLTLERLTYRAGDVPALKLAIVADANGQSLAYAWANADATRIGINLGWVQVGLEVEPSAPTR
ncbi:MAG TPA: hypothetical protein VGC30_14940 [Dokdonella sp.]